MVKWELRYTKQAKKDAKKISSGGLKEKCLEILSIIEVNPYQNPPPYEKLVGDLAGSCSRRINIQHRLVYQIMDQEKIVKILRMWTHYE